MMKETAKKMAEIAKTHQHVRGIVVPRRWYYYIIEFHYEGPTSNMNPTEEASAALSKAEEKAVKKAKAAGLDMRGAYAWPDGSLYFYIRMRKPVACWPEELHKIFNEPGLHLGMVTEKTDFQTFGSGIDVLTLEEKFAGLPREEHNALIARRIAEREAFYAEYRKARDECDTCKPGTVACKDCWEVCRAAEKAQDEWSARKRPLRA